ncbi:MAG: nuclease-related domain-containing protein [Dermatophilaceae bacterium]
MLFIVFPVVALSLLGGLSLWAYSRSAEEGGCVGAILIVVILLGYAVWMRRDIAEMLEMIREGGSFLKGARGELLVHQALKSLPDEFIVFHDFHPVDLTTGKPVRWNVDHIVVGPTGVFVIDAKNYKNSVVQSADKSGFTRGNVNQAQRNAIELKQRLVRWSRDELAGLFVVPVVAYTQPEARLERLREGAVRTVPLRVLMNEVQSHSEAAIDLEKAGRIARVLYAQMPADLQAAFKPEFAAFGELSKAARYAMRDARLKAQAEAPMMHTETPHLEPAEVTADIPVVCPWCGGRLARRTARSGQRAGKPFLGCENFSKTGCRYGFNLEE